MAGAGCRNPLPANRAERGFSDSGTGDTSQETSRSGRHPGGSQFHSLEPETSRGAAENRLQGSAIQDEEAGCRGPSRSHPRGCHGGAEANVCRWVLRAGCTDSSVENIPCAAGSSRTSATAIAVRAAEAESPRPQSAVDRALAGSRCHAWGTCDAISALTTSRAGIAVRSRSTLFPRCPPT